MTLTPEEERQREALRLGRAAQAAGLPVIYIHGRPYADPGADAPEPTPEPTESPFPWDLWDAWED